MRLALLAVAVAILVVGCGGEDSATPPTDTEKPPGEATQIRTYWLRDGKVWPTERVIPESDAIATFALEELLAGPTEQEQADLHFETALPAGLEPPEVTIEEGVATVDPDTEL